MDLTDLELTPDLAIPVDIATVALGILGVRGSGKTNTAVDFVEELLKREIPVVIVDTVGVWWGLRSTSDGEGAAYPVVVFGGEHGDVPLEEGAGKIIADAVLDHGMSAVIDTSGLSKAAARRFLLAFVLHVYHRKAKDRTPLHVVFDEADELAPQRLGGKDPTQAKLLSAMEDFVRRGRSRGLGCTLVTQRPASINKDVLTQVDLLVLMRMSGFTDIKAVNDWVSVQGQVEQAKKVRESLASLNTGTGWVWWPQFLPEPQLVTFRERRTFDSSATPKLGQVALVPTKRAEVDLTQLGEQIAATVEKAKAEDPAALKAQIVALEKQLREQPVATADPVEVIREVPVDVVREVNVVPDEMLDQLSRFVDEIHGIQTRGDVWLRNIENLREMIRGNPPAPVHKTRTETPRKTLMERAAEMRASGDKPALPSLDFAKRVGHDGPHLPQQLAPGQAAAFVDSAFPGSAELSPMQRSILTVLAQRGASSRKRIGAFAGKAHGGGAFTTAMGQLGQLGYIEQAGGLSDITDAGRSALGTPEPLPTGQALIDSLLGKMSAMERSIFETLIEAYPEGLTRAEIGERSGKAAGGGAFTTAMGKLGRVELVRREGNVNYVSNEVGEAMHG